MITASLPIKSSPCCSTGLLPESRDFLFNCNVNALKSSSSSCSSKRFKSIISCDASSSSSSSSDNEIPKLEPFSRSKFERAAKDPPLIDKSEAQLADYCSTLEGENSYDCWQAYFELKDLEKEYTKEEVERLIIEAGGVKSLVGCLHGVAAIHKAHKQEEGGHNDEADDEWKMKSSADADADAETKMARQTQIHVHVPDGLPKTAEEIEEEEKARMPDSDFTRMLRHRGKHAAWYSPTPDHQTD
ncbi:CCG-binding protein 1 [Bienertia sinuspersici]